MERNTIICPNVAAAQQQTWKQSGLAGSKLNIFVTKNTKSICWRTGSKRNWRNQNCGKHEIDRNNNIVSIHTKQIKHTLAVTKDKTTWVRNGRENKRRSMTNRLAGIDYSVANGEERMTAVLKQCQHCLPYNTMFTVHQNDNNNIKQKAAVFFAILLVWKIDYVMIVDVICRCALQLCSFNSSDIDITYESDWTI